MRSGDVERLDAVVGDDHDAAGDGHATESCGCAAGGVNDTHPTIPPSRRTADVRADGRVAELTARPLGRAVGTVPAVDVRIGVTQAPRELTIEMPDDERDDAEKQIEAALAGAVDVLWLTDKRGRGVGVPAAKIAYIELGTNDGDRRIGFGG